MSRQLPVLARDQRSIARVGRSQSHVGRVLAALAPDILRIAERVATQRLEARRNRIAEPVATPNQSESFHLSEVEIDVAVPFVRRITMRNLTAWQNDAPTDAIDPQQPKGSGVGRKLGMLGISSLLTLGVGVLARRVGPFSGQSNTIIDINRESNP